MHNVSLFAIACCAVIFSVLSAIAPIPAIRISSHIKRAGKA
jgi:hypothetical protein